VSGTTGEGNAGSEGKRLDSWIERLLGAGIQYSCMPECVHACSLATGWTRIARYCVRRQEAKGRSAGKVFRMRAAFLIRFCLLAISPTAGLSYHGMPLRVTWTWGSASDYDFGVRLASMWYLCDGSWVLRILRWGCTVRRAAWGLG
jgi:hypothetical protein